MPTATLPARASVEFLRKQSKHLHKAFGDGAPEAVARIREHLPRAGQLPADQVPSMDLSLQEVQHALACEYGFGKWEELMAAAVGPTFEDLARLTQREIQIMLREVDQRDLVQAMQGAPRDLLERVLENMSERVQGFITTEMAFHQDADQATIAGSRQRMVDMVEDGIGRGQITWPPVPPAEREPEPPRRPDERLAHIHRPLQSLSVQEIVGILQGLAERARDEGILSLEPLTHSGAASLLKEGVNLIVDGTEPDLVQDLLETRAATILRNRTIRGHMAIEGVMSIESGDNPRIVEHKMTTYFVEGGEYEPGPSTEPSLQKMIEDLGPTPVSRMSLNQMAWFYTHLASLRRQEGIEALAPIGEAADDSMLATGLREATHEDEGRRAPQQIIEAMKAHLQDLRVEIERRHWLVIEGIVGIQMGKKPKDLVKDAKAKAEQRVEELRSAGLPGPTS